MHAIPHYGKSWWWRTSEIHLAAIGRTSLLTAIPNDPQQFVAIYLVLLFNQPCKCAVHVQPVEGFFCDDREKSVAEKPGQLSIQVRCRFLFHVVDG